MAIYEGSRYEDTVQQVVAGTSVLYPKVEVPAVAVFFHTVVVGERMERLAVRFLGDPERWVDIAAVNPEVFYPDSLTPGASIRIPER